MIPKIFWEKFKKNFQDHFALKNLTQAFIWAFISPRSPRYPSRYPMEGQVVTLNWNWVVILSWNYLYSFKTPYLWTNFSLCSIEQTLSVKFYLFALKPLFLIHKCVYESTPYNLIPCTIVI